MNCGKKDSGIQIVHVSFSSTRSLFEEYNIYFRNFYKEKYGYDLEIQMSYGGSGSQSQAIMNGLKADIISLALEFDVNSILKKTNKINKNWKFKFPNHSSPLSSCIVFLVRKSNPLNIKDWDDLTSSNLTVITPNPKISGAAKWNYMAMWGFYYLKYSKEDEEIKKFIKSIYRNVPISDSSSRSALLTFIERKIGDVLITWESDALLIVNKLYPHQYEIIRPSISIQTEIPVTIVDSVSNAKGSYEFAREYIKNLYSEEAQEIIARNFFRPRNEKVLNQYRHYFSDIYLFRIEDIFGSWENAYEKYFSDGGIFDEIYKE